MQEVQADTARKAERQTHRDKETGNTPKKTRQRRTYSETGRPSEAGGQSSTEKPGPQKASGFPEMEQKVVRGMRLDPGLGETGLAGDSPLRVFQRHSSGVELGTGAPLAGVSTRHPTPFYPPHQAGCPAEATD